MRARQETLQLSFGVRPQRITVRASILPTAATFLLLGCPPADDCLQRAQVRVRSPGGTREATIYPGGCAEVVLAPQVTVDFRHPGGDRGGGGVFAVRDSAAAITARWLTEDTLEVSYPAGITVAKRETALRNRDARIAVVYREQSRP
jgi:hypothetical protein